MSPSGRRPLAEQVHLPPITRRGIEFIRQRTKRTVLRRLEDMGYGPSPDRYNGLFQGARREVDEYFAHDPVLLSRVDYSCRMAVK